MTVAVDVRLRRADFELAVAFSATDGVTALFGPSGAGKTSVLNMIAGVLTPDHGRITAGEQVLFDSAAQIDVPVPQRAIGYVFQDGRLFPHLSVRHNLTYGYRLTPAARRYADIDAVVELLDLARLLTRAPASLSGGEQQRVAIGRALLTSPRLLLLDEPLASLDAARKAEIMPYLERLRDHLRVPMIYVTHDPREIDRLANRVVEIEAGRVARVDVGRPSMNGAIG